MGEIELPLDSQGFLRRECPNCQREFKWHHGPTEEMPEDEPDPAEYYCPYCGTSAAPDQWWTSDQVEVIQKAALHEAMPQVEHELKKALKPLNKSGFVKAEVKSDPLNPPPPLFEPEDMVAVASPCHPYEPAKVMEDWKGSLHCLVCGQPFTLDPPLPDS
jgi:predicted nucleic acid-binding Zn ribbon protein